MRCRNCVTLVDGETVTDDNFSEDCEIGDKKSGCVVPNGVFINDARYYVNNSDTLVIFVHGMIDHHERSKYIAYYFNRIKISVYMYDLRGMGLSGPKEGRNILHLEDFRQYALDLEFLIKNRIMGGSFRRIYIMGHGYGCQTVLTLDILNDGVRNIANNIHGMVFVNPCTVMGIINGLPKVCRLAVRGMNFLNPEFPLYRPLSIIKKNSSSVGGICDDDPLVGDNEFCECDKEPEPTPLKPTGSMTERAAKDSKFSLKMFKNYCDKDDTLKDEEESEDEGEGEEDDEYSEDENVSEEEGEEEEGEDDEEVEESDEDEGEVEESDEDDDFKLPVPIPEPDYINKKRNEARTIGIRKRKEEVMAVREEGRHEHPNQRKTRLKKTPLDEEYFTLHPAGLSQVEPSLTLPPLPYEGGPRIDLESVQSTETFFSLPKEDYGPKLENDERVFQGYMSANYMKQMVDESEFLNLNMHCVRTPCCILCAEDDEISVRKTTEEVFYSLSSVEKQLVIIKHGGHDLINDMSIRRQVMDRVYRWIWEREFNPQFVELSLDAEQVSTTTTTRKVTKV